jgi:hypothetical protein
MNNNLMKLPKIIKDSSISSQRWIQARSISVKRTSGGLKYYQKIVKELEEYELEWNQTGETIMDPIKRSRLW